MGYSSPVETILTCMRSPHGPIVGEKMAEGGTMAGARGGRGGGCGVLVSCMTVVLELCSGKSSHDDNAGIRQWQMGGEQVHRTIVLILRSDAVPHKQGLAILPCVRRKVQDRSSERQWRTKRARSC